MTKHSPRALTWIACLAVLAAAHTEPAHASAPRDVWVTAQVKLALLRADDVGGFTIDVDTWDGLVTLHGLTASPAQRERARDLALTVDGVNEVRNLLAVVPEAERQRTADEDARLRARLEEALARDPELEASSIGVDSVHDGIAVLEGRADSPAAHLRAVDTARRVQGVRLVGSGIRSPDPLTDRQLWREALATGIGETDAALDAWIVGKARALLRAGPGLSPATTTVDSVDGVVTLFGTVLSEREKETALRLVEPLAGVRAVHDELQVVPTEAAPRAAALDALVARSVRERLRESPRLRDDAIDVEVSNGVVRLSGQVGSPDEKWRALDTAETAEGVIRIVDGLRVGPSGRG